ncbi:MAG: copper chaperone PCu(A)C [Pseudomonadota bacterium]
MRSTVLSLMLAAVVAAPAYADDKATKEMAGMDMTKAGNLMIHEPWARASLGQTPNSAAYMVLEIMGEEPDRLLGGSTPMAGKVELHTHMIEDGVAKMRPVEVIEIQPGEPTVLEPGGLHLMLMGLTEKLEAGKTMELTLVFDDAGDVTLDIPIKGLRDAGHASHGHGTN